MKEFELLYKIKDLERDIVMFITRDSFECNNFPLSTPTQIRIVNYILKHGKNNIYQKDIEKNLNLTRATLSGVLKTMEKNGIIKREINENDGRSKKIILSREIEKKFIKNQNKLIKTEKILTKDINKQELLVFTNVLNKMKENINDYYVDKEGND